SLDIAFRLERRRWTVQRVVDGAAVEGAGTAEVAGHAQVLGQKVHGKAPPFLYQCNALLGAIRLEHAHEHTEHTGNESQAQGQGDEEFDEAQARLLLNWSQGLHGWKLIT